ncbi:hypothetical protein HED60_16855 [Planctomycetales bacterium ZRK34]|nr:hypothetical protein HED60_16855 [Planctomycetales bacterium ZRK34]
MPCLVVLIAAFFPRLAIVLIWLFSDWLGAAYQTAIWPLLGFFFLPFTTLAYALAIHAVGALQGLYLVIFVLAVLLDLGSFGGGYRVRRRRR